MLLPGATVGVLGGGQLGRMLGLVARRMGYRFVVYSPQQGSPAAAVADREFAAPYGDEGALSEFAREVDVVTVEFENVPSAALECVGRSVPVRPGLPVLHVSQNRTREKAFLAAAGLPHVPYLPVSRAEQLEGALRSLGAPAIVKTAGFGYDGKGQVRLEGESDLPAARKLLATGPAVLERLIDFERELSVLVARTAAGDITTYGPIENLHEQGILDLSRVPAGCGELSRRRSLELAVELAHALDLVGLICVELFELGDGELLVNEIAPRPHNSGHLSIEACAVSQFEAQLRCACGLPMGEGGFRSPAAMANLLGDLWQGGEPDWLGALAIPGVSLHLYGKEEWRAGRKMGHLTALAPTPEEAVARVRQARLALTGG